jgi:phage baseplate assembly protein W
VNVDHPYHFDAHGHTAQTDGDGHLRDMIEQVLFTAPGERVNRPSFGSSLLQQVFAPNTDELAAALQFLVQASLQEWLGDLIEVESVEVAAEPQGQEGVLLVTVAYLVRQSGQRQVASFSQPGAVR